MEVSIEPMTNEESLPETDRDRDLSREQTHARTQRQDRAERIWRKSPIEAYKKENQNLTEVDLNNRIRVIQRFDEFIKNEINSDTDGGIEVSGVRDAVEADIEKYRDRVLKKQNIADGTIRTRLAILSMFYNTLDKKQAIAGNPAEKPFSEFQSNNKTEPDRPFIPLNRMKEFLNWLDYPLSRAMWLLALKHGIRKGEEINIDLRCLHIRHPIFDEIRNRYDIQLDPRIRDNPDTLLIYGKFNQGDEIPNDNIPGWSGSGEKRASGNKRMQESGSVLPIDSELKTALVEWLLVRPATPELTVQPLFVNVGGDEAKRIPRKMVGRKLWRRDAYRDSIQWYQREVSLETCPTCDQAVIEENPESGSRTGRRFRCRNPDCRETHWRSIYWKTGLSTEQKVTHHQARHYFSSAHSPENSKLHQGVIPDKVRKKAIRGDTLENQDTEDKLYIEDQYQEFDSDIRSPYLNGIYKFGVYDDPIPAVGEK